MHEAGLAVFLLQLVLLSLAPAADAAQPPVEITTCGVVLDGAVREAFLSANLDCSAYPNMDVLPAIRFLGNTTLDLRGFTLTGSPTGLIGETESMVRCERKCTIVGNGGSIVGGLHAVEVEKKVYVLDATLRDTSLRAIESNGIAEIDNVTIPGSRIEAVAANRRVIIRNSTITGNGGVPQADGTLISSSAVVFGNSVLIFDSVITDNQWAGAEAGYNRLRIENSTVTRNGLHPNCGVTRNCKFDIGSVKRPRIENTQCARSLDMTAWQCTGSTPYTPEDDPGIHNWAVCGLD